MSDEAKKIACAIIHSVSCGNVGPEAEVATFAADIRAYANRRAAEAAEDMRRRAAAELAYYDSPGDTVARILALPLSAEPRPAEGRDTMKPDWFEAEHDALEAARAAGTITAEEYQRQMAELRRDASRIEYEQDMKDAGRGHLLP